jgi:long-subunit acyl-CoA synthetase (AMP-forming)
MTRDDAHEALRGLLYASFRARATPIVQDTDGGTPGATLWSTARIWVERFRRLGLRSGDRVVLALPASRAHVCVTIAAWWEGLTLCPVAPGVELEHALDALDARVCVSDRDAPHCLVVGEDRCPITDPAAREPMHERSAGIALIMGTSGTTSRGGRRIALSYGNVLAQLTSHADALGHDVNSVALSVLPWHHSFGLLVDVWPVLLSGGWVVAAPEAARDPGATLRAAALHHATHLCLVPLQAARLLAEPAGADALRKLAGGVVGGARVGADLALALADTRLRAGYGQTEASPGITLGEPGEWCAGAIGRPIGCVTAIVDGTLRVRGPNVCAGLWDRGLRALTPGRWLDTRDRVRADGRGGYVFLGRSDDSFKLSNGRLIDAPALEARVRLAIAPGADAVLLPDGDGVCVAIIGCARIDERSVLDALGETRLVVNRIAHLADTHEVRSHKGDPDRDAIARRLATRTPALAA